LTAKMMKHFVFSVLLLVSANSCKKEIYLVSSDKAVVGSFSEVFEVFWKGMNQNYVFWDVDRYRIDWDETYREYKTKFSVLNINKAEDLKTGHSYFAEMVQGLSDGHFSITFDHPFLKDDTIIADREQKNGISDERLFFDNPERYFDPNSTIYATESDRGMRLVYATINNTLLYFHCNKLFLTEAYQSNRSARNLLNVFFEGIHSPRTEAIILDLRNNSGGDVADLNFLLGRFVDSPHKFGYIKYKYGNNRLDYTPYLDANVLPMGDGSATRKPIYALSNHRTESLAEICTMALKTFPKCTVVGTGSRGALGILANNNILYNGGSFWVGDFMRVNTSAVSISDLEFRNYERVGLNPDIHIEHDDNSDSDSVLEYVIKQH